MKNNSFFICLLAFILLMCSCKTKKVAHDIYVATKENIKTNHTKYQALVDTSNLLKIEIDKSKLKIIETIKITEYDAESGKPIKETETKRETIQDSDKVVAEEENKGQSEVKNDSLNHIANISKKIESETEEESIGGQESFGKHFGIVIGLALSFLLVYLLRKLRIN